MHGCDAMNTQDIYTRVLHLTGLAHDDFSDRVIPIGELFKILGEIVRAATSLIESIGSDRLGEIIEACEKFFDIYTASIDIKNCPNGLRCEMKQHVRSMIRTSIVQLSELSGGATLSLSLGVSP